MMSDKPLYEDTMLSRASITAASGWCGPTERGYTIDDLELLKAAMRWEGPHYVELFGPYPPEEPQPKPPLREYLLAEGFDADKVDTYLAEREQRAADQERRYAALKAEQATWRYRFRQWRRERRERIRTAIAVLRGEHECGY